MSLGSAAGVVRGGVDLAKEATDAEVLGILGAARAALVRTAEHVDAILGSRAMSVGVDHEELGRSIRYRYPGAPFSMGSSPWAIRRRPPGIGEHTKEAWFVDAPGCRDPSVRKP